MNGCLVLDEVPILESANPLLGNQKVTEGRGNHDKPHGLCSVVVGGV